MNKYEEIKANVCNIEKSYYKRCKEVDEALHNMYERELERSFEIMKCKVKDVVKDMSDKEIDYISKRLLKEGVIDCRMFFLLRLCWEDVNDTPLNLSDIKEEMKEDVKGAKGDLLSLLLITMMLS